MQDFARNQVGAQLNTLASSVLTLEPESEGGHHAERRFHDDHHHDDDSHAADQWAAPDSNGRAAVGFEGFESHLTEQHRGGRHGSGRHHIANGSSTGGGDFQDISLDDAPSAVAAKALSPPGKGGGAAAMAALREENAVLKQRLAAVEAVSSASNSTARLCRTSLRCCLFPAGASTPNTMLRHDVELRASCPRR